MNTPVVNLRMRDTPSFGTWLANNGWSATLKRCPHPEHQVRRYLFWRRGNWIWRRGEETACLGELWTHWQASQ